jgi:glycosyltransferase involved in cell wall biosynthesis/GT2 family glycosyltransferase
MGAPILAELLAQLLDPEWYLASYPDVWALGADPVTHFLNHGLADGRNPNGWFHRAWYRDNYPDVADSGVSPLLHYLHTGAAALYNPHPRFNAAWYVRQHPEAAANPLLYHMRVGTARDWATEPAASVADYLPSTATPLRRPPEVSVDVVIPVHHGLAQVRRCVEAVLADPDRPPGRVIVVDDLSPDVVLSAWVDQLAAARRIERLRNRQPRGFLGSANRGIAAAGTHDVVILGSGTILPPGAIGRLAAQAYAEPRIASVSPLSDHALLPSGMTAAELDGICQAVNVARGPPVPVSVLSCMYIRRAAINDSGAFDEAAFGQESGGEIDFCRRTEARGWQHVLACDTYIGTHPVRAAEGAHPDADRVAERYPDHVSLLARHAVADPAGPFRFAITACRFRRSGKPTVLLVFHGLGGGAQRQMMSLVDRFSTEANFLLLFATSQGVALTAPGVLDPPLFIAAKDRADDLVELLRSCAVTRVHLQHLKGLAYDVRALVHRLGVPFDTTVHDYFAICPQVNLLPWPDAPYCGEPGPAGCNACIAARPADGATEILAWRRERAWQFLEADRVFCPSEDVRNRLARYGLAGRARVVPHEPVQAEPWPLKPRPVRGPTLRIALLGVMANLKGAVAVAGLTELAGPAGLEIHIIGPVEGDFPARVRGMVHITGAYQEADLPNLIAAVKPHVVWFPSPCPETYSYTLTTAINLGLPIVATDIGSFPARLAGRPLTWVVDPMLSPAGWLEVFGRVREALRKPRPDVEDYYARHYLNPGPQGLNPKPPGLTPGPRELKPRPHGIADLRHSGRLSVVVIPERLDSGIPSAAAYVRLLQPLDHLAQTGKAPFDMVLADADTALRCRADVVLTHRHAIGDLGLADDLARHAHGNGSTLVYDLDEDLLTGIRDHADIRDRAGALDRQAVVRRMLRHADRVFVSTPALAAAIHPTRATVVPDGLDERLWCDQPRPLPSHDGLVRILLLGADVQDAGLGLVMPALMRLKQEYGGWVTISLVGPPPTGGLPPWIQIVEMLGSARASYPGFVQWLTSQPGWDIGLAAMADTAVNRSRFGLRAMEYAALKLAVVASGPPGFHDLLPDASLAGSGAGVCYASIDWLIRNPMLRGDMASKAHRGFLATGTLASQTVARCAVWKDIGAPDMRHSGVTARRP